MKAFISRVAKYTNKNYIKPFVHNKKQRELYNRLGQVGNLCQIHESLAVQRGKGIVIGKNVHVGSGGYIDGRGGVVIGDNTHISRNVTIYSANHNYKIGALPYDQRLLCGLVTIGQNVWIGMNVSIVPGVTIGENAIIGMGSVVTKDVPPHSIVGGNPALVIKERDARDLEQRLQNYLPGGVAGVPVDQKEYNKYVKLTDIDSSRIVFVLSTGRSGSTSISDTLAQIPTVTSLHEPNFNLIRLSAEYITRAKSESDIFKELQAYFQHTSFFNSSDELYVESDQKLVPFVPMLNKLFPECKFVWIFREPKSFVKSAVARDWFKYDASQNILENGVLLDPTERSQGLRIGGNSLDVVSNEVWNSYNLAERNAWYWLYWNRLIEKNLEEITENRIFVVQLKELNASMLYLIKFLGLDPKDSVEALQTHKMRKKDKKNLVNMHLDEQSIADAAKEICDQYYQEISRKYNTL